MLQAAGLAEAGFSGTSGYQTSAFTQAMYVQARKAGRP